MILSGLQKMTLLDFPGRIACTVFTGGCDFRCPFCHNFDLAEGKTPPVMGEEELLSFLNSRGVEEIEIILSDQPPQADPASGKFRHIMKR